MATLRKRPVRDVNYWEINYTDPQSGKRVKRLLGKCSQVPKAEANDELLRVKARLAGITGTHSRIWNVPQFGDFVRTTYMPWHESEYPDSHERVRIVIENHLLPRFEFKRLNEIGKIEGDQYKIDRRREKYAVGNRSDPKYRKVMPSTIDKELRTLKAIINYAFEAEVIDRNRLAKVKSPKSLTSKPPPYYERDDLLKLYDTCRLLTEGYERVHKRRTDLALYVPGDLRGAMWKFYANSGARRKEALLVERTWVGQDGLKFLSIVENDDDSDDEDAEVGGRLKSGRWREVPINDGLLESIEVLKCYSKDHYLFPRYTDPHSITTSFKRDVKRAGLNGTPHWLRHTYITHLVRIGVPLRVVQAFAGHSDYATTERYAHVKVDRFVSNTRELNL